MITWRVKGDGTEDFTSIVNAVTAIPSIALTDDYKIEVYLNTGGSRVYNEYITRGALITNGFTVEIVGMVGSVDVLDSQIVVNNAGSYVWNISGIFYGQYGCILSNFECNDATYCVCVERARPALVRNMRIHGNVANGIYRSRYGIVIDSCIIDTTSVAINTYAGVTALNCLLRAPNALYGASTGLINLYGCSIYATGWTSFGSLGYLIFNRCIYVSSGDLLPKLSFINDELMRSTYLSLWRNSILYSTSLGVGYLNTVDSFDDYFGVFVDEIDNWDIKNFDPEFNETGGIEEYLTLKSNSLALPENQTARNNLLYTGHKITPSDIGAYTNYEAPDFPSVEDVLTRATTNNVQGEYVPADIANHLAPNAFGYNGEFTGTLTVTAPNPASLVSASSASGESVVAVRTDVQSNIIWVRYRIFGNGNAWSDANATFSRTGDGNITVTGLDESTNYEYIIYVFNSGCQSDWSAPLVALTTGTCPTGSNINWPRWIFASICKHFDDCRGDYDLFIEGQFRDAGAPDKDFLELRVDGPYITEINKNYYKLYVEVNVLIQSQMDNTNYHRIYDDMGKVASMFTTVNLYKYGTGSEDTQEHFGCLLLLQDTQNRNRIQINNFGQVDPKTRLTQATVEGHYEITLQGD